MINTVCNFLEKYNIKNESVIIAFSSGPDSCAMARILNELKSDFNLEIVLAYFNHMWRKEAVLEEQFTADFAKKFNMKYILGCAPKNASHTEETARDLRYEFFGGSIHHSIILVIIELILLIIGCIIVIAEDSILGAVISLIQGYIFGVVAIMVLTFISAGLFVSIIILIMMLIAACLMFS